jgi:hypothetical protein
MIQKKYYGYILDFVIIGIGTLLIIVIWLPVQEGFRRNKSTFVQENEDITGFILCHYSPLSVIYAYTPVALSGSKETGFTQWITNIWTLKIYYYGFLPLWIISAGLVYFIHRLLCYRKNLFKRYNIE